ncbi:MAG: putative DNA-binding domain-containing protein [Proteobacteria bacterium]|nr:putative DNA-binding domain-containing protein [Pseudomonadota bacterium]
MGEARENFRSIQYAFTAHIRDPTNVSAPIDVEDRRVEIYRDLLYRNVEGFMSNSFPVLRSVIDDSQWHSMIRRYFRTHQARTPLFPQLPKEFLHYLADPNTPDYEPKFIQELAHYEWLELEASLDKREISDCVIDDAADCLSGIPVLNPTIRVHSYKYPVHRIGPAFQPSQASGDLTYLVVYRDRTDDVGFMQLNVITARLVDLIMQNTGSVGQSLLEIIADELQHPDPAIVINGGKHILAELLSRDVIIGAVHV